jgi:hypothetical protein
VTQIAAFQALQLARALHENPRSLAVYVDVEMMVFNTPMSRLR